MSTQPTDPSAPAFINRLPIEDLRQLASLDTVHKRFIAEVDRLRAERERFQLAWRSARARALDLADARDEVIEAWDDTLQDLIGVRAELARQKTAADR
jgi:hypothetical protein